MQLVSTIIRPTEKAPCARRPHRGTLARTIMTIFAFEGVTPLLGSGAWAAPTAAIIGRCELGERASVWFGATLRGDNERIVIGAESNIQDGSVLHTDAGIELIIGERVTVGHMVMLHGCVVGDLSLIGIGSIVMNGARIGSRSILGAGSLVPEGKQIPDGVLAFGSPAKVVRPLTDQEIVMLELSAAHYVDKCSRFASSLIAV